MSFIEQWQADYHASHDCDPGPCMCKCGCTQQMGCRALGGMCSVCHVRYLRDDDKHGFKQEDKHENRNKKNTTFKTK